MGSGWSESQHIWDSQFVMAGQLLTLVRITILANLNSNEIPYIPRSKWALSSAKRLSRHPS